MHCGFFLFQFAVHKGKAWRGAARPGCSPAYLWGDVAALAEPLWCQPLQVSMHKRDKHWRYFVYRALQNVHYRLAQIVSVLLCTMRLGGGGCLCYGVIQCVCVCVCSRINAFSDIMFYLWPECFWDVDLFHVLNTRTDIQQSSLLPFIITEH